jgi:hypothetical protein
MAILIVTGFDWADAGPAEKVAALAMAAAALTAASRRQVVLLLSFSYMQSSFLLGTVLN